MRLFAILVLLGLVMTPALSKRASNMRGAVSLNLYRKLQGDDVKEVEQTEQDDNRPEEDDSESNGSPQDNRKGDESDKKDVKPPSPPRPPYLWSLPTFPYMPQNGNSIPYAYGNIYPGVWNYHSFMRGQPIINPLSYYPLPGQLNTRGFY